MTKKQLDSMKVITKLIMSDSKLRKEYLSTSNVFISQGLSDEAREEGYLNVSFRLYEVHINKYDNNTVLVFNHGKKRNVTTFYKFNPDTYNSIELID
jgi:hypothetical protein